MSFALIANIKASNANVATTTGIDTSGANILIAVVVTYSLTATGATVSDSKSNTWTSITNYVNGNSNIAIWYAKNPTVGSSHTATANRGSGYPTIFFAAFSGADTTSPFDVETGANSATGTTLATGSITTVSGALVITGISENNPGNKTIDSGFTRQDIQQDNSYECGAWAYLESTGAINPTWTEATSNVARSAAIASFKPAAGGGSSSPQSLLLMGCQ